MRLLEKYVLKNFVISFVFCIVLLIVLGVIGDILGFLDDIFKHNIPLGSILQFYFYLAPFAFVNMVPFACLLSGVYVFNSLSKTHEITAVIASGVSLWKLLRPIVFFTFLLCLATFIMNNKVVPQTMAKANRIRQEELEHSNDKATRRDIAIYGQGDQIIFAKSYIAKTKTLKNVIIHKQDKNNDITEKMSISKLVWDGKGGWVGEDVIIFQIGPDGDFAQEPNIFKKKEVFVGETPKDFMMNQWDPRFMSYAQLKEYISIFNVGATSTVSRLLVDLNYKISFPFAALFIVLVGIPFSIETGRASALIGMARGIGVAVLFLPLVAICLALGKGGTLSPVLAAWLGNIIFAGVGIYYINRKS